jgi:hypothetical protein
LAIAFVDKEKSEGESQDRADKTHFMTSWKDSRAAAPDHYKKLLIYL